MQFWTSRGFAVVDVNYGGSTGYGREYRERLKAHGASSTRPTASTRRGTWPAEGDVDADRFLIRGGSAGGYTTLCALTFHDGFAAGASYYGIADLEPFAHRRHAQVRVALPVHADRPVPGGRRRYRARSPIHFTDGLCPCGAPGGRGRGGSTRPGRDDGRGARGEGAALRLHAVRRGAARVPEGRRRSGGRYEAELSFYAQVLGFERGRRPEPRDPRTSASRGVRGEPGCGPAPRAGEGARPLGDASARSRR